MALCGSYLECAPNELGKTYSSQSFPFFLDLGTGDQRLLAHVPLEERFSSLVVRRNHRSTESASLGCGLGIGIFDKPPRWYWSRWQQTQSRNTAALWQEKQVGTSAGLFLSLVSPSTSLWHLFDPASKLHRIFPWHFDGKWVSKGHAHANNKRDRREKTKLNEEEKTSVLRMLRVRSSHQIMSQVFIH